MRSDTNDTATHPNRGGRLRRTTFRVAAGLLTVALLVTGGRLLISGWFDPKDGGIHRFQDIAWGVIEGAILLAAIAPQLRRPARHVAALQQALAGFAALVLTMALTLSVDAPTIVAGVLLLVLVALHPTRRELAHIRGKLDPVRLVVAVAGALPLLAFALHQAALMRTTAASNPLVHASGFGGACAAALGLILVALLAAVRGGAGLPAWSAVAGALVLGIGSIAFPHHASSLGTTGGAAAIAGAILFLGATVRTREHPAQRLSLMSWNAVGSRNRQASSPHAGDGGAVTTARRTVVAETSQSHQSTH